MTTPPISLSADADRELAEIEALLTGKVDQPGGCASPFDLDAEVRALERDDVDRAPSRPQGVWTDEWTESQLPYFHMMMERCRKVVAVTTPKNTRRTLIRWCFAGMVPKTKLRATFNDCCYELNVRPYVVQAMIQHQWYRRGLVFAEPLPHMADPVHEGLLSEATLRSFDAGADTAVAAWTHPSSYVADLIAHVVRAGHSDDEADIAIASLVDSGLLGMRNGRVWFIGRSPEFLANRRTSFARSFIEPQDPPTPSPGDALTPEEQELLFGTNEDDAD